MRPPRNCLPTRRIGVGRTPISWRRSTSTTPRSRCGSRRRCATTTPARSWPVPWPASCRSTTPRCPTATCCCCCPVRPTATATELAARGFPVALGARRVQKCQELVDEIRSAGGEAVALPLDVTDAESVKGFVHRASEDLGDIELLVAGAGDTYFGRLHEISTDTFESQVQIHLIGANRLATAVLPGMVERQRGDLIFVGSDVALRQRPHMGAYGAAKAALVAMVTNYQMEL